MDSSPWDGGGGQWGKAIPQMMMGLMSEHREPSNPKYLCTHPEPHRSHEDGAGSAGGSIEIAPYQEV